MPLLQLLMSCINRHRFTYYKQQANAIIRVYTIKEQTLKSALISLPEAPFNSIIYTFEAYGYCSDFLLSLTNFPYGLLLHAPGSVPYVPSSRGRT